MTEDLFLFLRFIREREAIRSWKEAGQPAPWTRDPVLQKYRFCNVRRRDDRVSRWLLKEYYPKFFGHTDDVWFAAAVARLINWPPTLKHLLDAGCVPSNLIHYDPKNFAGGLENYHQINPKTYTGAYMLYAGGRNPKYKGVIKSDFIANHVLIDLFEQREKLRAALKMKRIQTFTEILMGCFSFSSFMAGQVAADLTYLPGQLAEASDLYTYAPAGPGSMRGLNRITGKPLGDAWDQPAFSNALGILREQVLSDIPALGGNDPLTLHDVQNCLCEYDKYRRAMKGEGQPRTLYKPETAF